jgi:hypothetical protein
LIVYTPDDNKVSPPELVNKVDGVDAEGVWKYKVKNKAKNKACKEDISQGRLFGLLFMDYKIHVYVIVQRYIHRDDFKEEGGGMCCRLVD